MSSNVFFSLAHLVALPKRLNVEARVMTRREQRIRRHKRVRNTVRFDLCALRLWFSNGCCLLTFLPAGYTTRFTTTQVEGSTERPRLAVFRSNNHIYAQVIDDVDGNTLVAASTLSPEIREKIGQEHSGNVEAAKLVGIKIAELCKAKNIETVSFDRGGFRYHGRVQALADAAREGGLTF
jgi:large subunit ribosomal protein L18